MYFIIVYIVMVSSIVKLIHIYPFPSDQVSLPPPAISIAPSAHQLSSIGTPGAESSERQQRIQLIVQEKLSNMSYRFGIILHHA